jgi:hypothetical protein
MAVRPQRTIVQVMSRRECAIALLLLSGAMPLSAWSTPRVQCYEDFELETQIAKDSVLIIGFQGGREKWDTEKTAIGKLARRLLPSVERLPTW